jgi:Amt family ammonium transporter
MDTPVISDSLLYLSTATDSLAQGMAKVAQSQADTAFFTANNVWMMVCTALVFIMHLGFACVEAGFTQAKNTVNILFKNVLTVAIGLLTYALFGFALMYPGFAEGASGWFSFAGWGLEPGAGGQGFGYQQGNYTYFTDFLFQAMFAATAATIVSGAVAERIKISAYLIFSVFLVGLIYPVIGSWKWGGGVLDRAESWDFLTEAGLSFYDFAGSTLVHSVGGWAALVGIAVLGPRIGKYQAKKINDFPGSSVPLATIGIFLLWLGWFGFNGGSVLSADPATTSLVLVTTCLAAAGGALGGVFTGSLMFNRLDLGMALNGILAGLVGITAGADQMNYLEAILIGLICGVLVVLSAILLDKLKLDDCVGAVSVHLTCGIFGTLAVGIFGEMASLEQFLIQLISVLTIGGATVGGSLLIFLALKYTIGVRVTPEHEALGMDSHEHGIRGYTIVYDA